VTAIILVWSTKFSSTGLLSLLREVPLPLGHRHPLPWFALPDSSKTLDPHLEKFYSLQFHVIKILHSSSVAPAISQLGAALCILIQIREPENDERLGVLLDWTSPARAALIVYLSGAQVLGEML